ncbi:hypothetical protein [Micromonospora inositola]|uniref:Helix-hairpin-helix domain-containing protein n=1 Tax=Micromonospora inositola TaxID=47865 RepID=A0A1C5JAH2_9ACTN|nr:hypothetical protein [Micromonospora inositola]SCG67604.1 hypothetical protein GA0070613_4329 [Micromonospora inositola]
MPSTFGQWLILILALLVGFAGGWVWRGRQAAAGPTAPIVEGDPVAGAAEVSAPTTATVHHERPTAVVDEVPPPAAVTEEPAPAEYDAPPATATLAANATTLPAADADTGRADHTEAAPAEAEVGPVADAEPAAPAEQPTPEAEEATTPVVVPAPRAAAEDGFTSDAATSPTQPETVPAATTPTEPQTVAAVATNGSGPAQTADDFRRIQGIGPKLAAALQAAGIRTYGQLGDLDEAALRETIRAAGLRAAPSLATWPQQARVLAGAGTEADRVLPAGAGEDA